MNKIMLYILNFFQKKEVVMKNNKLRIINYNEKVGTAFSVSPNGVLIVDVNNTEFRKEFLEQLNRTH